MKMDQWLIRTSGNRIEGPFGREQVIGLIREGKLGPQDEICRANHYWIYLHEQRELLEQLGIQLPRTGAQGAAAGAADEEITETQTETETPASDIQVTPPPAASLTNPMPEDYDGSTAVLSKSTGARVTPFAPKPATSRPRVPPAVSVAGISVLRGSLERSSVWRGLAWIMVGAGALVLIAVLRLLRSAG
jgi:hypothetical protein